MNCQKILIIEDDPDILELLEYNLKKNRFHVVTSNNGESGLHLIKKNSFDLIILDLMLPGMDGIEVCKKIRQDQCTTPIILLTAKSEESDIIVGLELGADDYITKPFSTKELVARIKAILRRTQLGETSSHSNIIQLGSLEINVDEYHVELNGDTIPLTLSEFKILQTMALKPGRVFTREQLLSFLSDQNTYVIDRNIDVHVRSIRKKLQNYGNIIKTIRGVGYKCTDQAL